MTRLKYNKRKVLHRDIEELSKEVGVEIFHPMHGEYNVYLNGQKVLEESGRSVYYFLLGIQLCKIGEVRI